MDNGRDAYDELYVYAMERPGFILQHVVDATAVQTANPDTKAIRLVFGLIGLYLRVEKQFSGHQVQQVHMILGQKKRAWPILNLPPDRGSISVVDVLAARRGPERDAAIDQWCQSLWTACSAHRGVVIDLLKEYQIA